MYDVTHLIEQNPVVFGLMALVCIWLFVTTLRALLSGWFRLMRKYPNQPEEPIARLKGLSGAIGHRLGGSMKGILSLSVCETGLRVGIMRVFGPFSSPFFVPWRDISISRKTGIFGERATLQFGDVPLGRLTIAGDIADRLARASEGRWPEPGPFREEPHGRRIRKALIRWAASTGLAALFFIIAPRVMRPSGPYPPIAIAILFPAIVFGIDAVISYIRQSKT